MDFIKVIKERNRMCKEIMNCSKCPLKVLKAKNNIPYWCSDAMLNFPEEAEAIVTKWSEENPAETRFSKLLKEYPDTILADKDVPELCVRKLGYKVPNCSKMNCKDCWGKEL